MGSAQSAVVRMRTVASSTFFLLLLLLHTSQALWCYTCNSIDGSDSDCENGSTNMKSEDCGSGLYYDCSVTKTCDKSTGEIWSRGCCDDRTSGCRETHREDYDRVSCVSSNCNTMDPSTGSTITTSLSVLLVSTLCIMLARQE